MELKYLMSFGIILIIFGYWWKLSAYWAIKNSPKLDKRLKEIEINNESFDDLSLREKFYIKFRDSGPFIWVICKNSGILFFCIGLISKILY